MVRELHFIDRKSRSSSGTQITIESFPQMGFGESEFAFMHDLCYILLPKYAIACNFGLPLKCLAGDKLFVRLAIRARGGRQTFLAENRMP